MTEIIIGAFAALFGALAWLNKERKDKKRQLEEVTREASEQKELLRQERVIEQARTESRKQSQEVQNEADQRPDSERPTGNFRS